MLKKISDYFRLYKSSITKEVEIDDYYLWKFRDNKININTFLKQLKLQNPDVSLVVLNDFVERQFSSKKEYYINLNTSIFISKVKGKCVRFYNGKTGELTVYGLVTEIELDYYSRRLNLTIQNPIFRYYNGINYRKFTFYLSFYDLNYIDIISANGIETIRNLLEFLEAKPKRI
jgi:hypothetical protein